MQQLPEEALRLQACVAGRYSIERELGRGGMGVVFLARDVALDRAVAIKLLPPRLASDPELRESFLREARLAAGLDHPNIVPIHSVEEHDDLVFFVMRFVDGETLGERVRSRGPMLSGEVMRIVQEVAWALGHAHSRGVVHRDVKPDNILIERESGRAVVADFGIAAAANVSDGNPLAGTVHYMSPEQARGEKLDGRSDVYSLGVTAFFALTGRHPFEASTVAGTIARRESEPAPLVSDLAPHASARLAAVIERCMSPEPAGRYAGGVELSKSVSDIRDTVPVVPGPIGSFLRDSEQIGGELGLYAMLMITLVVGLEAASGGTDFLGLTSLAQTVAGTIMLGLSVVRFGQLKMQIRDLLKAGYGHESVSQSLEIHEQQRREAESILPDGGFGGKALGAFAGGAIIASWGGLFAGVLPELIEPLAFAIAAFGPPAFVYELRRRKRGKRSIWNRLMAGKVGRMFFKMMGLGLPAPAATPALQTQHTECVIDAAVEELFAALPPAVQGEFSDVPRVARKLREEAARLRTNGEAGSPTRLAEAVAALENLRLDLMRAAGAVPGELTAGIDAARQIADQVDAIVEVEEDVAG